MTKTSVGIRGQRALTVLTGTVVGAVAIVIFYWAQSILIPVALAAFLTFLLSPFVSLLRQRGLGRTPALFLIVCVAALGLGSVGWVVTTQISSLLRELPNYTQNVREKARSLRDFASGPSGLKKMIWEINQEFGGTTPSRRGDRSVPDVDVGQPATLVLEPRNPVWLSRITTFLTPVMEYFGELALAFILVVFMLQKREELRNRIIRLVGQGRVVAATKFVDEAGQRISRFLLAQALVNGTFGVILGLGLLVIGVKYALLWGFLAAMFRYLPYIGSCLAAVLPFSLSLAMFDGWGAALMVIGLFLTLELVVANFVEPWLYSQSIGVSEIAMLVSAAFWAFLWGPIGLVLSSPLTVCLMMLGRYVPQLEFLAVLLGDEPALDPSISFYQRLLARDQDEAEVLIFDRLKTVSPDQIYDAMLVPALSATKRNRQRGDISEAEDLSVLESIRKIVKDLGERRFNQSTSAESGNHASPSLSASSQRAISIFGCPAHGDVDGVASEMVRELLDPVYWDVELIAPGTLTAEVVKLAGEKKPALVYIAAIAPGGMAHTRYLCKRLRARCPDLKIVVYRGGLKTSGQQAPGQLEEAGADLVATTLLKTRQLLSSLQPVLSQGLCKLQSDDRSAVRVEPLDGEPRSRRGRDREMAVTAVGP